jgi:hypothetical protein
LISTGNSYRIFETTTAKFRSINTDEDTSWRLYFEPESNNIDYRDMQKLVFNTFSDSQWTISPPSLRSFVKDFKVIAKEKGDNDTIVNFILSFEFLRGAPVGKEKARGRHVVELSKNDIIPVETILEKDQN